MNELFTGFFLQILLGAWITIKVAICALILGLLLGLLGSSAQSIPNKPVQWLVRSLISIVRGVPELVVIFFVYFGGTIILTNIFGSYVDVSAFIAGVVALAMIFGSYASQTFRAAFEAVPRGQLEAARALALTSWQVFFRVHLPQAARHALPGLGNLWLVLLKDTALVSLIGLPDMMNRAKTAASTTHQPFVYLLFAALLYLLMTSVSQIGLNKLMTRVSRHVRSVWT
jgi:His/Glu/Gln/Arg/opine family amino acid ABC transporter permease subunit